MSTEAITNHSILSPTDEALLFTEGRTANTFAPDPVTDADLRRIWELSKFGPTAANTNPMRVLYLRTEEGKQRLVPHMGGNNQAKTASAPAVAILAADTDFHEEIPKLFPARPEMRDNFSGDATAREAFARNNSWLQAGYFILAIRAAGFAAGPMGGFDAAGVDQEFFAGTTWKSILVVNIGKPGADAWFPRLPRHEYETAVKLG
jgi:3-hydroxypropanoate dehydrogenase